VNLDLASGMSIRSMRISSGVVVAAASWERRRRWIVTKDLTNPQTVYNPYLTQGT
jgi:hypothetical protein